MCAPLLWVLCSKGTLAHVRIVSLIRMDVVFHQATTSIFASSYFSRCDHARQKKQSQRPRHEQTTKARFQDPRISFSTVQNQRIERQCIQILPPHSWNSRLFRNATKYQYLADTILMRGKHTFVQKVARKMLRHRRIPALTHVIGTWMVRTWMECVVMRLTSRFLYISLVLKAPLIRDACYNTA